MRPNIELDLNRGIFGRITFFHCEDVIFTDVYRIQTRKKPFKTLLEFTKKISQINMDVLLDPGPQFMRGTK